MIARDFYNRDTILVAKDLLGKIINHRVNDLVLTARIVEVEAYLGPHDKAAHSAKGITNRTKIMFGPPGYAYVYLIYGIHHCLNVVTEKPGSGSAVLIRAVEPLSNIFTRTQGPGLLCKAMHIDKTLNGHDLLSANFFISEPEDKDNFSIIAKPRICIIYAGDWVNKPLRFYIANNKFISKL